MPTKSVAAFALQTSEFGRHLVDANRKATRAVASASAVSIVASARAHNWPVSQSMIGIRHTEKGRGTSAVVYARNGFLYMFERGADGSRPSGSGARRGVRLRGNVRAGRQANAVAALFGQGSGWWIQTRRAKAVATPHGPRRYVHHPGFRGRPFWRAGVRNVEPVARKIFEQSVHRALVRTFV